MKTLLSVSTVFLVVTFVFNSCNELEYVPNVINTPLFSDKGEFQAAGYWSMWSDFEPHFSCSVTNHIGLMVNGSFSFSPIFSGNNSNEGISKIHSIIEMGTGYYSMLSPIQRFEIYGGFGYGNF